MQLDLIFRHPPAITSSADHLQVGGRTVLLQCVRHRRARRYLLRLLPEGTARVTIPRGGSAAEARRFAEKHAAWLERQFQRLEKNPAPPKEWRIGTEILLRGEPVRIESIGPGFVRLGSEPVAAGDATDVRPVLQQYLRRLAARELPPRLLALAMQHGLTVRRVTVRNQRTRWGSCSRRATISLNWRLIQVPPFVRDYILLHELMHLRQMNHSPRFWREVQSVCPDYPAAERWLKQHRELLHAGR